MIKRKNKNNIELFFCIKEKKMSSDYDYYSDSDSDTEPNSSKQLTLGEKLRRVGEEEKGFENDIRKKIQAKLKAKQIDNKDALIAPIHKDIITKYNSVNVIVGKQSLGKTVTALEEIIKIGYMGTHHLLVYITKDGEENDKSWQTLKNMIEMPIVLVAEEDAEDCIDEILTAKSMYYRIRRERTKNEIPEEQKEDLFEVLHVENFEKKFLHTIFLFDDISNSKLFSSEESFFSQLLRRCRHNNVSFFLLIQGWKGIKPHIKNEITTLYLFPGFNKQQIRFIYGQSASNLDWDEFFEKYNEVNKIKNTNPDDHPMLIVQCTDGGDTFIRK